MFSFIRKEGIALSEEIVACAETQYGFEFPEILRDYYLTNNGAAINDMNMNLENEVYNVARFLKLETICMLLDDEDAELEYVPFASDWGDDLYCWSVIDGKVYITYTDSIGYDFIADSVNQFIELLESSATAR